MDTVPIFKRIVPFDSCMRYILSHTGRTWSEAGPYSAFLIVDIASGFPNEILKVDTYTYKTCHSSFLRQLLSIDSSCKLIPHKLSRHGRKSQDTRHLTSTKSNHIVLARPARWDSRSTKHRTSTRICRLYHRRQWNQWCIYCLQSSQEETW